MTYKLKNKTLKLFHAFIYLHQQDYKSNMITLKM